MSAQAALIELHKDLGRRYKLHRERVESIWRGFDTQQRTEAVKAGVAEGIMLEHPKDERLGTVNLITPEWNLRDLTQSGPDFLLSLLRHRATTSLFDQYCAGVNSQPGDRDLILESMHSSGLRCSASVPDNGFTIFLGDAGHYGHSLCPTAKAHTDDVAAELAPAIRAGLCVPQSTGELILMRQSSLMQHLFILIDDILDLGSTTRKRGLPARKDARTTSGSLSAPTQSASGEALKETATQLQARARDCQSALDDTMSLLRMEPAFLAHAVNLWFFSRPELVRDERGRDLAISDRYISTSFFDMVQDLLMRTAIWGYMSRVLALLSGPAVGGRRQQLPLLQDLSNVGHLAYTQAQSHLKRHLQTGSGKRLFKRLAPTSDGAPSRVVMKVKPDSLTREPQLHYLLRLCQSETNEAKAVGWLEKLDDLHRLHPGEREKLEEREADALGDLAAIVGFSHSLSQSLRVPSSSRAGGQAFLGRLGSISSDLDRCKPGLDISEFAVPIDQLAEPGMSDGAFKALSDLTSDAVGASMSRLFEALVEESVSEVQSRLQTQNEPSRTGHDQHIPITESSLTNDHFPGRELAQEPKVKLKTRPERSSAFDAEREPWIPSVPADTHQVQVHQVKHATAAVFAHFFSKSKPRGSVSWTAFESAMADVGFAITPRAGSIFTFDPPQGFIPQRPITFHRPHQSSIEGFHLLYFAHRLRRAFGWDERSFRT